MKKEVIEHFEQKSGISKNLACKIKSLTEFLEEIIAGKEDEQLVERMAELPKLAAKLLMKRTRIVLRIFRRKYSITIPLIL